MGATLYYHVEYFDTKNFYGAKMNCRSDGGHLASPVNSDQLDRINLLRLSIPSNPWIGLLNPNRVTCSDDGCDNQLLWDDGATFLWGDYSGTAPDISLDNSEYSVHLLSSDMEDADGGGAKCYICQFDCDNIFTPDYTCPNNPSLSAPDEYYLHGKKFYKYHETATTFEQAQATCNSEGANLAMFRDDSEYLTLKGLMGKIFFLLNKSLKL